MPVHRLLPLVFLGCLISLPARGAEQTDSIPTVYSTIIRVDQATLAVNGYYELSAPYRKSLRPTYCTRYRNLYHGRTNPGGDPDLNDVYSRLTGALLIRVESEWNTPSRLTYPPDSLRRMEVGTGFSAPGPDTLFTFPSYVAREGAQAAWSEIEKTDIVQRLAEHGRYAVGATEWFRYQWDPGESTLEWLFVVSTEPRAPREAALLRIDWPDQVVSRGIPFTPEVLVHNFSDEPLDFRVHLRLQDGWGGLQEDTQPVTGLPADAAQRVIFPAVTLPRLATAQISFGLEGPDGSAWVDSYPGTDSLGRSFRSSPLPVFRAVTAERRLERFPPPGVPMDFDGDGRLDVFQLGGAPKLLRNLGGGRFDDVTDQVSVQLRPDPGQVYCADLTGDSHPDLLILSYEQPPLFLSGGGEGSFRDVTAAAGMAGIAGCLDAAIVDLDGDGDLDIILASYRQESVLRNDGAGHFIDVAAEAGISDSGETANIAAGDLNADGLPDLVFGNRGERSKVYANLGNGRFRLVSGPWDFTEARVSLVMDWDGDGLPDIVFTRYTESTLVYRNLGGLAFEPVPPESTGIPETWSICAGDLDRDGAPEIVCGTWAGDRLLKRENGRWVDYSDHLNPAGNKAGTSLATRSNPEFIDLDGDGDLDLYGDSVIRENLGVPSGIDERGPTPPRRFTGLGRAQGVLLSWINPLDSDTEGCLLRFSPERFPETPDAGAPIPNGRNGIVPGGPGVFQSYLDPSLPEGTPRFYSVFAYDHAGNVSAAAQARAVPVDPGSGQVRMWLEESPDSNHSFDVWLVHAPDADSGRASLDGQDLKLPVVAAAAGVRRGTFRCDAPGDHVLRACVIRGGHEECLAAAFSLAAFDADLGGRLASPDGRLSLRAPAGSIPAETAILYLPGELLSPDQESGDPRELSRFALLPALSLAGSPAILSFRYTNLDLGPAQDPSRLCLTRVGGPALSCTVDPESQTIMAQVSQLGLFACVLGDQGRSAVWDRGFLALRRTTGNPTRGESRFQVEVKAPLRVRAAVFDVTGREVARVLDETYGPGVKEIAWDGRAKDGTVSGSGVYFLRVWSGHRALRGRVVRIR